MTTPRLARRSKPTLRARLQTYWLLGVSIVAGALWGGWAVATLPALRLSSLSVTGISHVSRDDVRQRAALDPRANVWLMDRGAVARRIEALPYVFGAYVHRRPLGHVWIEVVERQPEACVRDADGNMLTIDRALRVLEAGCAVKSLPIYRVRGVLDADAGAFLRDPELLVLQRDARALTSTSARYRAFSHDVFGDFEATMSDGIRIRFGDDGDLDRKQRLIEPILAQLGPRKTEVRALDVRAPATPVVEFRANCATGASLAGAPCASATASAVK